ncbi:hypothetical protein PtB15_13B335 [Puccinia triticina]|nr:hypothetical protein PtB15_13B335 [Puccinia triticina]
MVKIWTIRMLLHFHLCKAQYLVNMFQSIWIANQSQSRTVLQDLELLYGTCSKRGDGKKLHSAALESSFTSPASMN